MGRKPSDNIARNITERWYDNTLKKSTPKVFLMNVGSVKSLLTAGYTEEQINNTIDYLVEHPPKNGMSSLAFVQYCIEDILMKLKVKEYAEREQFFAEEEVMSTVDTSNADKFNKQTNGGLKGTIKF